MQACSGRVIGNPELPHGGVEHISCAEVWVSPEYANSWPATPAVAAVEQARHPGGAVERASSALPSCRARGWREGCCLPCAA